MEIINERPEGMSHAEYRELRTRQNKEIKAHKRGSLVYTTTEIVELPKVEGKPVETKTIKHVAFRGVASKL